MFRSSTIAIVKRNDSHPIGLGGAMEPASAAWKVMDRSPCVQKTTGSPTTVPSDKHTKKLWNITILMDKSTVNGQFQ